MEIILHIQLLQCLLMLSFLFLKYLKGKCPFTSCLCRHFIFHEGVSVRHEAGCVGSQLLPVYVFDAPICVNILSQQAQVGAQRESLKFEPRWLASDICNYALLHTLGKVILWRRLTRLIRKVSCLMSYCLKLN